MGDKAAQLNLDEEIENRLPLKELAAEKQGIR